MKPLKLLTATALIGCTALAATAAEPAQDRRGMMRNPFPIDIATAEARAGERFAALDKDGDGKVTRDEFAAGGMMGGHGGMMGIGMMACPADMMDGPGGMMCGGAMGDMEGMGGMGAHGPGPHGMPGHGAMGGPGAGGAGPGGDGAGARGEMREAFQARMAELDPEIFKRLDGNGDGKLAAEEFGMAKVHDAAHAVMRESMFKRLDKNADGTLTKDEMPDPASRLRAMDANSDGSVTRDEARTWHRANPTTTD